MTNPAFRIEHDSMGDVEVPVDALWGAQTQRAVANFRISGRRLPRAMIRALALVKQAAARSNGALGLLSAAQADAIAAAAAEVARGDHDAQFPIDVLQTGSGTSSNMNCNEVIAALVARRGQQALHPNDHVNMSQSSNDVMPTCIHVAAVLLLREQLMPALCRLASSIRTQELRHGAVVKTGRTHLMDAMPITVAQELSGWRTQIEHGMARLRAVEPRLLQLAQGGTAVGTGINAPEGFGSAVCEQLRILTGIEFEPSRNYFEAMSSQDTAVELSGQLRVLAVGMLKIANDLRWMNSGPLAGLGELSLAATQPGSSIMPGKVNPVIPEAVAMACVQVIGLDAAIAMAGQSGSFQLNVMLPLVGVNVCDAIALLSGAAQSLAAQAIDGLVLHPERMARALQINPVLVTALNPLIGYEAGAAIARRALAEQRPILDVAAEMTSISRDRLRELLDPLQLTRGGLPKP